MNGVSTGRPVQLHIIHDLGGGSAKWLEDFVKADTERTNLILRSFAHDTAAGTGISLHAAAEADAPAIRVWKWRDPIAAVALRHPEYHQALEEIVREHGVQGIIVSSLIGHSLEALETGLPTLVVNHDYFPYCPAINLYFNGMCRECDGRRLAECTTKNAAFNAFAGFDAASRLAVRERFVELVLDPRITMVVPSRSVQQNLRALDSRFEQARFVTIAHGYANPLPSVLSPAMDDERLRVLILGQMSTAKGIDLLRATIDTITGIADVYMVGARDQGEEFRSRDHVHVIDDYDFNELPSHVANIKPHLALLLSIVPETFSYALSELLMMGVPVAATRIGSFAERIKDGEDGFLFEPRPDALVRLVARLDAERESLRKVRSRIAGWRPRSAEEMVADYRRELPIATTMPTVAAAVPPATAEFAAQALALASMWKEVKALHRRLAAMHGVRERDEAGRRDHERRVAAEREQMETRLTSAYRLVAEQESAIVALNQRADRLQTQVRARDAQVEQILGSSSWRLTRPYRVAGKFIKDLRVLARCIASGSRPASQILPNFRKVLAAARSGGIPGVKAAMLALQPLMVPPTAWDDYRAAFRATVRPRIVNAIAGMSRKPRISIIVPTYNTPEAMLREMLDSVCNQIYPEWELCVADDGSTEARVAQVLREYAARDSRIKLDIAESNGGVSRASNRALAMATGEMTILVDHDDILEEQALFRVAEAAVIDQPDMVYSDEVQITVDGGLACKFVYRPAFSLEYLRGHPYIVHLAGFRTALLREIGGFDESLRISQDYDLILRVVERARRIVHIPEILYRWRIHPTSAGHARMHEVMTVSTSLLQRHLDRAGVAATAEPGDGFNLFRVRYDLAPGSRVAIIIPTRNHGDILRQCIESIRRTVTYVPYDIVVVNHDSDDRETLRYLASLGDSVRVLRYSGVFNFSSINNWAAGQLPPVYTHYLFCNNDIEATETGWLERMLAQVRQPRVAIVGAKLLYPDRRTVQHAGVLVGAFRGAEHYGKFVSLPAQGIEPGYECRLVVSHDVSAVTAACLLMRRDVFEQIGGFDSRLAVGFGDVDLCLRALEAGYRIIFCPDAVLLHHESYTRGTSNIDPHPGDTTEFQVRWADFIKKGDPYYNPGLSLTSTSWAVRNPLHCTFELRRRIYERGSELPSIAGEPVARPAAPARAVAQGE